MSDAFDIRPATLEDSPTIREIRNAVIRDSLAIWTSTEQDEDEARAWLAPQVERGTALVAVTSAMPEETILGFAVASPWHAYEGYARTVEDSVYVQDAAQGRGLGGRLLAALVEASRTAGDRTMVAQIEARNAQSVHLHARVGFGVVGTIEAAGEKHGELLDLTLMSLRL